ncbi:MAG TPA: glycosyltransferase family 1 protein [Anaerolineae bacterium]|nr:glycosyltransferase family 1 protein [Anaerolineae bacterium]
MRILIDFRKFDGVVGGVERGVVEVAHHVAGWGHTVTLLCKQSRQAEVERLFEDAAGVTVLPLRVRSHVISLRNAWLDSWTIQEIAAERETDLIHFPYNWSFPFRKRVPTILTVHDVIPFTFREAMDRFTHTFLYKPGIRLACRLNDVIVTVSEFSKQDIAEKAGVPRDKIRVIPNGLREPAPPDEELDRALDERWGLQDGFVLNVGGIHERKNVPRLVHAFARLVRQHGYPGKLLITGSVSGAPYQIRMKRVCDAAVTAEGMEDRIVFTGFIPDAELDSLLRRADLLIYPSLYEGFGIPILEAMQAGTPVVTSNVAAMPEVAGGAALLIDPHSVDEMVAAMKRLLEDKALRRDLIRKGKERARLFSWERTARQYLELYREVGASS